MAGFHLVIWLTSKPSSLISTPAPSFHSQNCQRERWRVSPLYRRGNRSPGRFVDWLEVVAKLQGDSENPAQGLPAHRSSRAAVDSCELCALHKCAWPWRWELRLKSSSHSTPQECPGVGRAPCVGERGDFFCYAKAPYRQAKAWNFQNSRFPLPPQKSFRSSSIYDMPVFRLSAFFQDRSSKLLFMKVHCKLQLVYINACYFFSFSFNNPEAFQNYVKFQQ